MIFQSEAGDASASLRLLVGTSMLKLCRHTAGESMLSARIWTFTAQLAMVRM